MQLLTFQNALAICNIDIEILSLRCHKLRKHYRYLNNYLTESAKKEYFERNFAWHAISAYKNDLSANLKKAAVMYLRPIPDSKSKDRLGIMKTNYNLKQEPEISSAFYFDLALRTFLAIK